MELRKNGKLIKSSKNGTDRMWSTTTHPYDRVELFDNSGTKLVSLRVKPIREDTHRSHIGSVIPISMIIVAALMLNILASLLLSGTSAAQAAEAMSPTEIAIDNLQENKKDIAETMVSIIPPQIIQQMIVEPAAIEEAAIETFRYVDIPLSEDTQAYIQTMCVTEERTRLITAMIWRESNFQSDIISATNDYGLMQINIGNHDNLKQELGITNFLDPFQSIQAGTYIINGLMDKHNNDINLALMEYNMGPSNAKKLWDQGIVSSKYSRAIIDKMAQLELIVKQ